MNIPIHKETTMNNVVKISLFSITITCIMLNFYGCALKTKFVLLRDIPPEALKIVYPSEVEVMTGEPPIGKEYIEYGTVTIDERWVSPIVTKSTSNDDLIELVRREAANQGADSVIKFSITGEHPARRARGIAIVYKK